MCTQATGDCQTTNNRQADQEEQLPDLTRLFKNRARDSDVIKKCKTMLIAGYSPQKTALLLRLPIEKVIDLYNNSYNPKCRRFANRNSYQDSKLALTMFQQGESLADICAALGGLHLYTVVMSLRQNGLAESAIEQRLPPEGDPLLIEYQRVCKRKSTSRYKAIQINPVQRVNVAQATTAR
ncbi:hypothetical protein OW756_06550 [Klebsiella pneumoniae]|uniref:hypothetical protein n=1 Tax=Klebsiella pneumoniae TaxID=573 RepID=UPI00217DDA75|nr:hypothetical protein [Klebsiella pneumoniae]MCS6333303.1 hypothetical protein [Klebsiella pneumoniae]HBQ8159795.1 hypothetical protein [Klebsiella pneumoniae]HBR0982752.1 hypothetical protein [Klebsiella pneumoniae]HBV2667529.1 hypothetical protein [Klebsiella pneumoniae]HEN4880805.1 hypothetical protein [Klebsiella pneumoniae]